MVKTSYYAYLGTYEPVKNQITAAFWHPKTHLLFTHLFFCTYLFYYASLQGIPKTTEILTNCQVFHMPLKRWKSLFKLHACQDPDMGTFFTDAQK